MVKKIILATTSPRRHEIAERMGLDFEIVPSEYEEDMTLKLEPEELAKTLAYGKAADVAKKCKEGIAIGVDTFISFKGKFLGKPKNKEDAFNMLKSFSGKSQEVYSGIALIDCETGETIKDFEVTKVYFRKMSDSEINQYIKTGEPMDKAGSYAIQKLGSIFIEKISGCYYNVMGFPVHNIYKNLRKMDVNIFDHEGWKG